MKTTAVNYSNPKIRKHKCRISWFRCIIFKMKMVHTSLIFLLHNCYKNTAMDELSTNAWSSIKQRSVLQTACVSHTCCGGRLKTRDRKTQDWKTKNQIAGVEKAGLENANQMAKVENAGPSSMERQMYKNVVYA